MDGKVDASSSQPSTSIPRRLQRAVRATYESEDSQHVENGDVEEAHPQSVGSSEMVDFVHV